MKPLQAYESQVRVTYFALFLPFVRFERENALNGKYFAQALRGILFIKILLLQKYHEWN